MAKIVRGTTSGTVESAQTESTPSPSQSQSNSDEKEVNDGSQPNIGDDSPSGSGAGIDSDDVDKAGVGGAPGDGSGAGHQSKELGNSDSAPTSEPTRRSSESTYGPANRASYLRRKSQRADLTDSERSWLADYESSKGRGKGGRPRKKADVGDSAAGAVPPVAGVTRTPKPPIVHEADNWRSRYRGGDASGRELLCTMIGDQWHRMLCTMEKQIAEAGMTPIVEVSNPETRDMLILAVDDIIPPWVKATPAIVATFKTTALTSQRFLKAKAIKEESEKKKRAVQVVTRPAQAPPALTSVPAAPEPEVERRAEEERAARPEIRINPQGRVLPPDHYIR